jgi:hypothetical protein
MNTVDNKLQKKLSKVYEFLKQNRKFNYKTQERYYKSVITPFNSTHEKVVALLYGIVYTQSQPKIDKIAEFFHKVFERNTDLLTFQGFLDMLGGQQQSPYNYNQLYNALKKQPGWGDKTSALFVKTIYHLHNQKYAAQLKIWDDSPCNIAEDDQLWLPVDIVIQNIFRTLGEKNVTFSNINRILLLSGYIGKKIEVWDDLWFWGFITQKGSGVERKLGFNVNKYWAYPYSDKRDAMIVTIERKAEEFIKILKQNEK